MNAYLCLKCVNAFFVLKMCKCFFVLKMCKCFFVLKMCKCFFVLKMCKCFSFILPPSDVINDQIVCLVCWPDRVGRVNVIPMELEVMGFY